MINGVAMASDGVRIAIDYRYLNKSCLGDAYPTPDIGDIIQRVGESPLHIYV